MTQKTYNILFLCSANSARSLMAEAIMQREGLGKFKAFSAGSNPATAPNDNAMALLERNNYDISQFRSKSWDEFGKEDAPLMDFVITVCDKAKGETCPIWPGQPMSAHWGVPDPVSFEGNEAHTGVIFAKTFAQLRNRITIFANLPIESLDALALQKEMDAIGEIQDSEDEDG
ncbi:arsenate reductase ArsC [Cognatishimia activa]|uniref:Arsenate reductase n=1 Tax=Cognatishimia activa TaxID=1715691 RepID=A0A0P1J7E4_9RHOB|nr:arsenate reductase ArsC [Cognatishimia activa]MEE2945911.1 arsenate reductase ArsC [Pseudomonadota bacterium]CUI84528.1 Arsenate reductase [Cognatishimia activa]CUK25705.1 Arsenate reductase [Cognatishimia activa]